MADLVAFLRARLGEDERVASKAAKFRYDHPKDAPWVRAQIAVDTGGAFTSDGLIARFADPARVLREVEAKRRILDLHGPLQLPATNYRPAILQCEYCASLCHSRSGLGCDTPIDAPWPCDTVRLLALPHADHPDYRPEWAVTP